MEDKNALVIVMRRDRADYQTFIHKMPQIEKNKKEVSQKTRKKRNQVANSDKKKIISKPASKRKSRGTITQVLKSNGYKGKKKGKKMRKKLGAEE